VVTAALIEEGLGPRAVNTFLEELEVDRVNPILQFGQVLLDPLQTSAHDQLNRPEVRPN
jgi:hypothetical protein